MLIGLLIGSYTAIYTAARSIQEINRLINLDPIKHKARIEKLIESLPRNKSARREQLMHAIEKRQARNIRNVKKSKQAVKPVAKPAAKPVIQKATLGGKPVVVAVYDDVVVIIVDVQYDFMELEHVNEHGVPVQKGKLPVNGTGKDYKNAVEIFADAMRNAGITVMFTQDWHPKGHMSFADSWLQADGSPAAPFKKILGGFRVNPNPLSGRGCLGELESAFANGMLDENDRPINTRQFIVGVTMWPIHCIQDTPGAEVAVRVLPGEESIHKGMSCIADSNSGFKDDSGVPTTLHEVLQTLGVKKIILLGIALDVCVKKTALHGLEFGYKEDFVVNLSRGVSPEDSIKTLNELYGLGVRLVYIDGLDDNDTLDVSDLMREGKIEFFESVQDYIKDLKNVGAQGAQGRRAQAGRQQITAQRRKYLDRWFTEMQDELVEMGERQATLNEKIGFVKEYVRAAEPFRKNPGEFEYLMSQIEPVLSGLQAAQKRHPRQAGPAPEEVKYQEEAKEVRGQGELSTQEKKELNKFLKVLHQMLASATNIDEKILDLKSALQAYGGGSRAVDKLIVNEAQRVLQQLESERRSQGRQGGGPRTQQPQPRKGRSQSTSRQREMTRQGEQKYAASLSTQEIKDRLDRTNELLKNYIERADIRARRAVWEHIINAKRAMEKGEDLSQLPLVKALDVLNTESRNSPRDAQIQLAVPSRSIPFQEYFNMAQPADFTSRDLAQHQNVLRELVDHDELEFLGNPREL